MRRSLLLLTTMALGVLMVSSGAQAASPRATCLQEAQTLTGLDLTGYNIIVGNNKSADYFTGKGTEGGDVFCGRGGDDQIDTLDAGDIFIGGAGNDTVGGSCSDVGGTTCINYGTFYGGGGDDFVTYVGGTGYFEQ